MTAMPADIIPLGARLKQRREELGLTQAQAARELEVARTAYRLWELEAARPAPDRWRTIAKWLGLSVSAMLHAAELIDEQEALDAAGIAGAAGLTGDSWDDRSGDATEGDFFSQERMMIAEQSRSGNISSDEAAALRRALARLQAATAGDAPAGWHGGEFSRRLVSGPLAPGLARAALLATAVGIPTEALDDGTLLISELVTNSVEHSRSAWVDVEISLTADRLRIAVADADTHPIRPRTPGPDGGWGLTFVAVLATRWGVEQRDDAKTVWVELDLT